MALRIASGFIFRPFRMGAVVKDTMILFQRPPTLRSVLNYSSDGAIFSDKALRLNIYRTARTKCRLHIRNPERIGPRLKEEYETNGLKNICCSDLGNFSLVMENEEDAEFAAELFLALLREQIRPPKLLRPIIANIASFCKDKNVLSVLKKLCHEADLQEFIKEHVESPLIILKYYALLYENHMYHDLLEEFESLHASRPEDKKISLIVMAALYQIGTPEAFQKATELIKQSVLSNQTPRRYLWIYALFAYNQGFNGIAYDLTDHEAFGESSKFKTNIKLGILKQTGKLEEAIQMIYKMLQQGTSGELNGSKLIICNEILSDLAKTVEQGAESDELHGSSLMKEFDQLRLSLSQSNSINLWDTSLEDLVFK